MQSNGTCETLNTTQRSNEEALADLECDVKHATQRDTMTM